MSRKNKWMIAAVAVGVLIISASVTQAQGVRRSAEPRLRPGARFWSNARVLGRPYRAYRYLRSYSLQPTSIEAGDEVVVTVDEARIMKGQDVLGVAQSGQKFRVTQVQGPWLGGTIEVDGQTISGWVRSRDVEIAASAEGDAQAGAAEQGARAIRSYSFEPAEQAPVYGTPTYRPRSTRIWGNMDFQERLGRVRGQR